MPLQNPEEPKSMADADQMEENVPEGFTSTRNVEMEEFGQK